MRKKRRKGGANWSWENWINSARGFFKGIDENMTADEKLETQINSRKRRPCEADLTKPMMTISSSSIQPNLEYVPGEFQYWTTWPFFDIMIGKNGSMRNAGFLHGYCDVVQPKVRGWWYRFPSELDRA